MRMVTVLFVAACLSAPAQQNPSPDPVERLIQQIDSDDYLVRRRAKKDLRELLARLKESDPNRMLDVVLLLERWVKAAPSAEVLVFLKSLLSGYSTYLPFAHCGGRGKVLERFPDALKGLTSEDASVRERMVRRLGRWGEPAAADMVFLMLQDENERVRKAALEALSRILPRPQDPRALPYLARMVQSSMDDASRFAAKALMLWGREGVKVLINALYGLHPYKKEKIAEVLAEVRTPHAMEVLGVLARERDGFVRAEAVSSIARIGGRKVSDFLIRALYDPDDSVRESAMRALSDLGIQRAAPHIIFALKHGNTDIRRTAAWALGDLGDIRIVEPLITALFHDEDRLVRQGAAGAMSRASNRRFVSALIKALEDRCEGVRCEAVSALAEIMSFDAVPKVISLLKEPSPEIRKHAAYALGRFCDRRATPPLIKALKDEDKDVREEAAQALAWLGDPRAVEPLINLLKKEKDADVREMVVEALGEIGDERAFDALISALNDPSESVRNAAVGALCSLGDPRAVPHLLQHIQKNRIDTDNVASTLLFLGEPGFQALLALADDPQIKDKDAIAFALGTTCDQRAVKPLLRLLKDEEPCVRIDAAQALWLLHATDAIPHLVEALQDEDLRVRIKVAETLCRLGDERGVKALLKMLREERDIEHRWSVMWALSEAWGDEVVDALIKALKDKDPYVRRRAARALGEIGDKRATDALIAALGDPAFEVRSSAIEALAFLKPKQGLEIFATALQDKSDWVRFHAVMALADLQDRRALKPLIRALFEDEEKSVRVQAAYALGRLGGAEAVSALAQALRNDFSLCVRVAAANSLGATGDAAAVKPLCKALKSDWDEIREAAAKSLCYLPPAHTAHAAPLLQQLFHNDGSPFVRVLCGITLFRITNNKRYLEKALKLIDKDSVTMHWSFEEVLRTLLKCDERIVFEALRLGTAVVRAEAASVLGAVKLKKAVPALIRTLQDEDVGVRSAAAWALGKIGGEYAIIALLGALEDRHGKVIRTAANSLHRITGCKFGTDKSMWFAWWVRRRRSRLFWSYTNCVED